MTTWNDWINGKSVPRGRNTDRFIKIVLTLEDRAHPPYRRLGENEWRRLHRAARAFKDQTRSDRVSPARAERPPDAADTIATALYGIEPLRDARSVVRVMELTGVRLGVRWRPEAPDDAFLCLSQLVRACLERSAGFAALLTVLRRQFPGLRSQIDKIAKASGRFVVPATLLGDQEREGLIRAFQSVKTPERLAQLYEQATDDPLCSATIPAAIADLEALLSPFPLFAFVEYVAAAVGAGNGAELHRWVDNHLDLLPAERHEELRRLRADCAERQGVMRRDTHLFVRLNPEKNGRYRIQAWIMSGGVTPTGNHEHELDVSLDEAESWLNGLFGMYREGSLADPDRVVVEFFLPPAELDLPVHSWLIDSTDGPAPLGSRYVVLVRPATRTSVRAWEKRWSRLIDLQTESSESRTHWVSECSAPDADADADDWEVLAVTCPEACAAPESMAALIEIGAPVALWIRGSKDSDQARERLTEVLRMWGVGELPERVRGLRRAGAADFADLRFVWDDANRRAPESMTWNTPGIRR